MAAFGLTVDSVGALINDAWKSLRVDRSWLSPFNHHHKQDSALVPATDPAHAPAIDRFAQGGGPEEPQELGLDFHNDPSMALSDGIVKAMTDAEEPN
jgi:hypothetical protein